MTETVKTALFIVAAALSLMVAFAMGPSAESENLDDLLGTRLNQFEVDVAKRLKIVKFDQETATTREFEVAENDGLWTIPSKQGYPADAARQMGEAATCLIDREVLRVAAKSALEHEELGVIDPSSSKLDSKAEGVGTRVTITDSNDSALADMIIGKPVKDAEGQYYVRNADQDVVYVVNLDPDKLSTKFDDWIEDDLLKLSPMDIRRVNIKDYSAELQPVLTAAGLSMQVKWDRRGEMTLKYDSDESKWLPVELLAFSPESKGFEPYELAEDEELDEETLRELRNGLDDLLLVDVERKPAGLSADLKAGEDFLKNQEAASSLIARGFAPLQLEANGPLDILSTEGEIVCTLENGVEYVLRFGNLQIDGENDSAEQPTENPTSDGEAATDESDDGINRYLFVMAQFNESMIEKPELADLPELPAGADESASEDPQAEPSTDKATSDDASADEASTNEATENTEEQEEEEEAAEGEAIAEESSETDSETASAEDSDDSEEESNDAASEEDKLADLIAEREAIEKENQRKLNEYQDKLTEGKERVAELNERFGDWYYVISNDVYKKIHLSRDEVIKTTESDEATEDGAGADDEAPTSIPGLPNLPINQP